MLKVGHIIHRDPAWCSSSQTAASNDTSDAVALLFSTATDGKLVFWSLNQSLDVWLRSALKKLSAEEVMGSNWEEDSRTASSLDDEQCCAEPKVVLVVKVHQSGVNDVAVMPGKDSFCY